MFALKSNMGLADVDRLIARIAEVRGVSTESLAGYRAMMAKSFQGKPQAEIDAWMRNQVYLALGMFLTACALAGVDACPMEGFDPARYDQALGLSGLGYTATVLAAVGYRAASDDAAGKPKVRYSRDEVLEVISRLGTD